MLPLATVPNLRAIGVIAEAFVCRNGEDTPALADEEAADHPPVIWPCCQGMLRFVSPYARATSVYMVVISCLFRAFCRDVMCQVMLDGVIRFPRRRENAVRACQYDVLCAFDDIEVLWGQVNTL